VIALGGAVVIGAVLFVFFRYVLHFFNWGYFSLSLLTAEIFFLGLVTQKIDNQPVYKIVPRGISFQQGKKSMRHRQIDPYFRDFVIQDNFIVRSERIISVFEVEPYDIALLNDQDREHFFVKLKQTIHVLPAQVQFIVRKEKAEMSDYSEHISSLYADALLDRENLIKHFVRDLTGLVEHSNLTTMKHYAVFSANCDSGKAKSKATAIKKLADAGIRFASSIASCGITVRPLTDDELSVFAKGILR
jgi:hypothetical protein